MPSYAHNRIFDTFIKLDRPPDNSEAFDQWVASDTHMELLDDDPRHTEIIAFAISKHAFIHSVVVPESRLANLDDIQLLNWNTGPVTSRASYSWRTNQEPVNIVLGNDIWDSNSELFSQPLVFYRTYRNPNNRIEKRFEILQEYVHLTDSNWDENQQAYCRYDHLGELEHVISISSQEDEDNSRGIVTLLRAPLEEYLAASQSVLVRLFDFMLLRFGDFERWPDAKKTVYEPEKSLIYTSVLDPGKASYKRGVQSLRPTRDNQQIFSAIRSDEKPNFDGKFPVFIILDLRHNSIATVTSNRASTTNYFEAHNNDLPYELSPAYFRAEVLFKYKMDTDKYTIEYGSIRCREAWSLKQFDVNAANQIQVYVCDLRNLPYEEQIYWQSFNEEPKAGLTKEVIERDILGIFTEDFPPLTKIKDVVERWNNSRWPWWTRRHPSLVSRVNSPVGNSRDEWAQEFLNLSQLVIEGFKTKGIRPILDAQNIEFNSDQRSIALLEKILRAGGDLEDHEKLAGLRTVQQIRTKVRGHASGSEANELSDNALSEHGSYLTHFEHVCAVVAEELAMIESALT